MKKQAFTLAEVLITLVIIGVIAAMTIPTLMGSTNNQEYRSKLKKVVSELNQAILLERTLYGNNVAQYILGEPERAMSMLSNHLSVIEQTSPTFFKTADGIVFSQFNGSCGMDVDLNGNKNGICRIDSWGDECVWVNIDCDPNNTTYGQAVAGNDAQDLSDWMYN